MFLYSFLFDFNSYVDSFANGIHPCYFRTVYAKFRTSHWYTTLLFRGLIRLVSVDEDGIFWYTPLLVQGLIHHIEAYSRPIRGIQPCYFRALYTGFDREWENCIGYTTLLFQGPIYRRTGQRQRAHRYTTLSFQVSYTRHRHIQFPKVPASSLT